MLTRQNVTPRKKQEGHDLPHTCTSRGLDRGKNRGRFHHETAQSLMTVVRVFLCLSEGTTDAARPPDPRAARGGAQCCKGAQQVPTTCTRTTSHKATSRGDHDTLPQTGMSVQVWHLVPTPPPPRCIHTTT
jgi:hypothetical protein